ncbi:MAG: hypothetical protein EOQ64_22010 [Mesorhizobium sp.]|uniref:hypothetical protein n=1 Tax=Mesorhizobium sp. TaxID=1871066 RepID=UPI000FE796D6|nr:hypothetical protein [Mesorhizobium sp.]RWG53998.1 MAG: hypothetical protein EOQ64_22010 [Mesorhizobium sp.]RWH36520.1 MAG: hypothetical protein EOQ78_26000 [Mesorhizobium sp.]
MTSIPFAQPGMAARDVSETFTSAEIFNSSIPHPVTEDFPVAADVALPAFSVVGLAATDTVAMATFVHAPGSKATGRLVLSGAGAVDDTITLGATVYTLKAAPTTVAGQIKIGATAAETASNLIAAINGGAGAGTAYGSLTTPHPDVSAQSDAAGIVGIVAKTAGAPGNAIATTETGAAIAFSNTTLVGGADQIGVAPLGITTAPVVDTDVAQRVAIYRAGNFNPDALNWDASFNTDDKREAAFRGAPAPTNILVRKRL